MGRSTPTLLSGNQQTGSSPRLRGTPKGRSRSEPCCRFIPAPAGNTWFSLLTTAEIAVHPRACGEHYRLAAFRDPRGGSSPRLRGTHLHGDRNSRRIRFIPAPAGNTRHGCGWGRYQPVHPRACGEHPLIYVARRCAAGSSPRLRGTLAHENALLSRDRFIPAPAGNTLPWPVAAAPPPVHPRACGEHISAPPPAITAIGSSPRLRGTRRKAAHDFCPFRFIPAPAGNTHL